MSKLEQSITPNKNTDFSIKLDIKYLNLPPIAKMILNELDSRNLKWSSNPFNQQWLADKCKCSLRWVRHCIALLAQQGFIAIVRLNKGKPYKTKNGFWTRPNIYIITPFLRWLESSKMYSLIVAKAEKIQQDFLQYRYRIIKDIIKDDTYPKITNKVHNIFESILKKIGIMKC